MKGVLNCQLALLIRMYKSGFGGLSHRRLRCERRQPGVTPLSLLLLRQTLAALLLAHPAQNV